MLFCIGGRVGPSRNLTLNSLTNSKYSLMFIIITVNREINSSNWIGSNNKCGRTSNLTRQSWKFNDTGLKSSIFKYKNLNHSLTRSCPASYSLAQRVSYYLQLNSNYIILYKKHHILPPTIKTKLIAKIFPEIWELL